MEQVPFMCDGVYSKNKNKNPQFPIFDQLESAVLLMAVNIWLGLVKVVGKKVPVLRISLSVPNLLLLSLLFSVGFAFFTVSSFLIQCHTISNICLLAENVSAHQLSKHVVFAVLTFLFFSSYCSRAEVDLNLTAFQKMEDEVIRRSMAYPFTIKMCCSGLGKRHSN